MWLLFEGGYSDDCLMLSVVSVASQTCSQLWKQVVQQRHPNDRGQKLLAPCCGYYLRAAIISLRASDCVATIRGQHVNYGT